MLDARTIALLERVSPPFLRAELADRIAVEESAWRLEAAFDEALRLAGDAPEESGTRNLPGDFWVGHLPALFARHASALDEHLLERFYRSDREDVRRALVANCHLTAGPLAQLTRLITADLASAGQGGGGAPDRARRAESMGRELLDAGHRFSRATFDRLLQIARSSGEDTPALGRIAPYAYRLLLRAPNLREDDLLRVYELLPKEDGRGPWRYVMDTLISHPASGYRLWRRLIDDRATLPLPDDFPLGRLLAAHPLARQDPRAWDLVCEQAAFDELAPFLTTASGSRLGVLIGHLADRFPDPLLGRLSSAFEPPDIGDFPADQLTPLLTHDDSGVRNRALELLGRSGAPKT